MFVLFNKNLNRYFKHPKIGIWWSHDHEEANKLLEVMKQLIVDSGLPELAAGLVVHEIADDIRELNNENQTSTFI